MVYSGVKLYGPYLSKDGRLRVVLVYSSGTKKTVSYPKYLIEKHLGRYLEEDETVHHKDGNPLNNDLQNLEVLPRSVHSSNDVLRISNITTICVMCGKKFEIQGNKVSDRNRNNSGPFCSRSCSGRYGALLQNKKMKPLPKVAIRRDYHKAKTFTSNEPVIGNNNSGQQYIGEPLTDNADGNTEA